MLDVYKIAVKLFASRCDLRHEQFVPIFHHWIQNQSVEGHRLIDIAEYGHVQDGPGTVLVGSEANFYTDSAQGRLGILYSRKLPLPETFQERLAAAIREVLKAADRLGKEPAAQGKLKFKTDELLIRLNDRLLAPPSEQTIAAARPDIEAVAKRFFGQAAQIESQFTPQTLVEFRVHASVAPSLAELLFK